MRRGAILVVPTIVVVVLYPWLYRYLFGLATVLLLTPQLLHATRDLGGYPGLVTLHFLVSLLLSLVLMMPIAVLIALAFRRMWWAVALLFGLWLLASDIAVVPDVWGKMADHVGYLWKLCEEFAIVFGLALGLTYVAWRLTSNYRWSGP